MHRIKFILVVILFLLLLLSIHDENQYLLSFPTRRSSDLDSPLVLKTVFRFEIVIKSKVGICKINQLYHFKAPLVLYLIHYMHMEFAFVYPRKRSEERRVGKECRSRKLPNHTLRIRKYMKSIYQLLR